MQEVIHPVPPHEDDDDRPIGRILSRREVLTLLGTAGAGLLVAACAPATTVTTAEATATPVALPEAATAASPAVQATAAAESATAVAANAQIAVPACIVRPEATEGPYYVDLGTLRADVREDRAGAPLLLTFNVAQIGDNSCTPLAGALVEIWHCDAEGQYSGVRDRSFNTNSQTWLRGAQVTDASGVATFTTIYPGWYPGRAVHIHFKVRPTEQTVFTSQIFFPEAFTDQVYAQSPYIGPNQRYTTNAQDGIYQELLLVEPVQSADGYAAVFPIGFDLT